MASAVIAIGAAVAGKAAAAIAIGAALSATAAAAIGAVVTFGVQYLGNKLFGSAEKPPGANRSSLQQNLEAGVLVNVTNTDSPIPVVVGSRRVGGIRTFGPRVHNTGNTHAAAVFIWSEGEISAVSELYFDDLAESDGFWNAGVITSRSYVGTDGQAADATLVADIDEWTDKHTNPGAAYSVVDLKYDRDQFPNGFPVVTADIAGVLVYDPRDAATKFSDNPALVIRHFLTNDRYGRRYPSSILDDDSFSEAANYCDQTISVPDGAGGTVSQKRYTCNGVIDTQQDPIPILNQLLTSCRGYFVWSGGLYKLIIDKAESSSFTFTRDHIVGQWMIHGLEQRKLYNRVHGRFFDAAQDYKPNFASASSDAFQADDGGQLLEATIELPFTTDYYMALNIAWLELKRSRQSLQVSFTSVLEGVRCEVGDVVAVTHETPGWVGKLFRVAGIEPRQDFDVRVTLTEYDPTVYDALVLDERSESPNTTLPDPRFPDAPGTPSITETLYLTRQNAVKVRADIEFVAAPNALTVHYRPEYRASGATDWIPLAQMPASGKEATGGAYLATVFDLAPGIYDFRVLAVNGLGVSAASITTSKEIIGLAAAPSAPTNVAVAAAGNTAVLTWDRSVDLDVLHGGAVNFLHAKKQTGATLADAISIGRGPLPGHASEAALPLLPGTYFVVFEDAGGVRSDAGTASTKGAQVLAYSTVGEVSEHPTFPGTPTNLAAGGGQLQLENNTLIDDYGSVDSIVNWDLEGGIKTSGSYLFSAGIDLGTVQSVRVRMDITAEIVNPLDTVDARTDNIDDWVDIDGTYNGQADLRALIRHTDDDPSGSPTWSEWMLIHAGEFEFRAAEFKVELETDDPQYNIICTELTARAENVP